MKESNLVPHASQFLVGNGFTDRREEHHPKAEPIEVAREGVEPSHSRV